MLLAICVTKWHYKYNIENYVFDPKKCQVEKTAFLGYTPHQSLLLLSFAQMTSENI